MSEALAPPAAAGRRLDQVLADLAGVSRAVASRWVVDGRVLVDGAARSRSHRLEGGERLRWEPPPAAEPSRPLPERVPLRVRYEDEHLLVVAKPAGLVVHPAAGHSSGTLVNALLGREGSRLSSVGGAGRPGIVHRLDKDTSGLLLVAKDDRAHQALARDLAAHRIQRRYLALAQGHLGETRTVDAPLGRHPRDRKRMAVVPDGRRAVTHLRVLERFGAGAAGRASGGGSGAADLVEATLETGRTHQIRVHLAHLHHPVVGDRAYGADPRLAARLGLERPFLHAWRPTFRHPVDGHTIDLTEDLPADLRRALDRLRG